MKISRIVVASIALSCGWAAPTLASSFYGGVVGGASSLRPDVGTSPFTLDSAVSFGGGAFVGYDFSERFSFELGYNFLGGAKLTSANNNAGIDYSAISAGALMYFYGDARDIAERNGFSIYGRLGVNSMKHETSIPLEKKDTIGIWAGIGAEWSMSNTISFRGELSSFDGDAQAARLSVLYRLRPAYQRPRVVAQTPTVAAKPAAVPTPPTTVQPQVQQPAAAPNTAIAQNNCVTPAANEPVNAAGCALFSGKVRGADFASGTAALTPVGSQVLDRLAQNLLSNRNIIIEIQVHTESFGDRSKAQQVAKQRTLAIARYLASRGVPLQRLRARAFGHAMPVAPDNSVAGRRQNNRVELRVLP